MQEESTPKAFSPVRLLTARRWVLITLVLVLLGGAVLVSLPYAIRAGMVSILETGEAHAVRIEDVDFNPFTAKFVLTGLRAERDGQALLTIDQARISMAWTPMLHKRLLVEKIELDGGAIRVELLDDGRTRVAGILPGAPATEPQDQPVQWGVGADRLSIRNTRVLVTSPRLQIDTVIERADLSPLRSWTAEIPGELAFEGSINGAPLAIELSIRPFGDVGVYQGHVTMNGLDIGPAQVFLADTLKTLEGMLHLDTAVNLTLDEAGSVEFNQEGDIRVESVHLATADTDTRTGTLAWSGRSDIRLLPDAPGPSVQLDGTLEGKDMALGLANRALSASTAQWQWNGTLDYAGDQPTAALQASGAFTGSGIAAQRTDTSHRLLAIGGIDVADIAVTGPSAIRLGEVTLEQVEVSRGADPDADPLVTLGRAYGTPLEWHGRDGLVLGDVKLTDLDARVLRDAGGGFPLIDALHAPAGTGEHAPPTAAGTAAEQPLPVSIAALTTGGKTDLRFRDETVKPAFETTLHLKQFRLGGLDSSHPDQPTTVTLDGQTDRYSTITLNGELYPFKPRPTLALEGKLRSIALPAFSAYSRNTLGYVVSSGTLDNDMKLTLDMGRIEGDNDLTLRKLTLSPDDDRKTERLKEQLAMPLDSALAMLRDKDDNIRLKLPVSGDIDDPKFNISDVINTALGKAMQKATTSYISYALQPYGTILGVVRIAGKMVNAVKLQPVSYAAGSTEPPADAGAYMDKIAGMLRDRPQVSLRLCGIAAESDRGALLNSRFLAEQEKQRGLFAKKPRIEDIPPPGQEEMEQLARQRAERVKEMLVQNHGIAPERLYLCHPEIDATAEGAPRVELSI